MPKITLILLLSLFTFSAFAQQSISGRVLNTDTKEPVEVATVTLHPVGSSSILSYTMTNDNGKYTLKSNKMPDSVTITVSAMTIERKSRTVKSDVKVVDFMVSEKTMELKEVIVKAPKIRQLGDTIHYDVASFLDETDRSIGDVLKKLPGVQVLSSGQIMYQNKEISKFYIEGLDLLQGKYGLATQNVDADKVASVQILENHQPVKALKGMEVPDNAAINLRLKQSAVGAFFATAQLGAGLPPVLLSNEAVAMRFTRSQQNMLVYKGDNTGRDVSQELTSYYGFRNSGSNNMLSVVAPSPPNIREQHRLFNDAHVASLNDLRTLKKDLTLTTNINFLHDKQKSSSYAKQEIFLTPTDSVQIEEDMTARLLKRELEGSITLEGNADDYFLNNKFNVRSSWNQRNSNIASDDPVMQALKQPSFHIENDFDYLKRNDAWRKKVIANIAYTSQNHTLGVSPVLFEELQNPDSLISQNVSFNRFSASAGVSGYRDFKKYSFGFNAGASFLQYNMESGMLSGLSNVPIVADSLQNKIGRTEAKISLSPSISYRATSGLRTSLSLPINALFLSRKDDIRDTNDKGVHLLFSPSFYMQYSLTSRINTSMNVSYSNNIGSVNEDYTGYILNTYRNMNRSDGLLSKSSNTNAYARIEYKNPFTTLFTALSLNYNNNWRNMLYDVVYNGIMSSSVGIEHPHTSQNFSANYSIGKSIDVINSEVRLGANYSHNQSLALNQGKVSKYNSDNYSVSPSITTNVARFMIIKYGASYSHGVTKIRDSKMKPVNNFTQNISTSFIPAKGLSFTFSANHYYNSVIQSSNRSAWFGNVGARYRAKNIDWMLDWTNVFNTRQFTNYSYSDISSYYSVYNLRPSEILLRVRFKIM